nr:hypothetical protein [Streptomyces sp. Alain-F2R5]
MDVLLPEADEESAAADSRCPAEGVVAGVVPCVPREQALTAGSTAAAEAARPGRGGQRGS